VSDQVHFVVVIQRSGCSTAISRVRSLDRSLAASYGLPIRHARRRPPRRAQRALRRSPSIRAAVPCELTDPAAAGEADRRGATEPTPSSVAGRLRVDEREPIVGCLGKLRLARKCHPPPDRWGRSGIQLAIDVRQGRLPNASSGTQVLAGHPGPVRAGEEGDNVSHLFRLANPTQWSHLSHRIEFLGRIERSEHVRVGGAGRNGVHR